LESSLCLENGVLWIARSARSAHLRPYDLDGRPLGEGFGFEGRDGVRASASGLAADVDHRLWVADVAGGRVRAFTLSGLEQQGFEGPGPPDADRPGALGGVFDIDVEGAEDGLRLLVSRRGPRRHGLFLIEPVGGRVHSLRPGGDPQGSFQGLAGVALHGPLALACEPSAGRVQVFRGLEFHFHFGIRVNPGRARGFEPRALARLSDGRVLVAHGGLGEGGVALFDAGGRILGHLAGPGLEADSVDSPSGVAVQEGGEDRKTLVALLDRDGTRVRILTLEGRCLGEFPGD